MSRTFVTNNTWPARVACACAAWAAVFLLGAAPALAAEKAAPAGMVLIEGASFTPIYNPDGTAATVTVAAFYLDAKPVTKGEFARFVSQAPRWSRSGAPAIFRDANYLKDWRNDVSPEPAGANAARVRAQPAVNVSWFAARAYCKAQGKRLPTVSEWEYAALAGAKSKDARNDDAFKKEVLQWYVTPAEAELPPVGAGQPNYWGLYDMHSLVWEWVDDFNTAISTGDNRSDTDSERSLFCGGSSGLSTDRADYAAYMRFGFRSSLTPAYAGQNLGFRCAQDEGVTP